MDDRMKYMLLKVVSIEGNVGYSSGRVFKLTTLIMERKKGGKHGKIH